MQQISSRRRSFFEQRGGWNRRKADGTIYFSSNFHRQDWSPDRPCPSSKRSPESKRTSRVISMTIRRIQTLIWAAGRIPPSLGPVFLHFRENRPQCVIQTLFAEVIPSILQALLTINTWREFISCLRKFQI